MTEFGHFAGSIHKGRIDAWGAGPFLIEVSGKTYRFGDSDRFGPYPANKHGDPIDSKPFFPERSPFWDAWTLWKTQGRRLAADGMTCVWNGASHG